jgi:predicted ATPase/class 3 adenylate cyclase
VALPTGTVTFLFTDLEGSTRLWEEHPDAMRSALARHDEILRDAVEKRDGYVVKTTGDGLHAAFAVAPDAVAAALDAQLQLLAEPWPLPEPLRVRMGLHTGVAEVRDGDYYGPAVNRAARVAAAAHGGQVVASAATADLVRDDLGAEITLLDLGEHRLRDLGRPERIVQIAHPDLPSDFPPLRSLDAYPGNLPVQRSAFVGRADDIAEVRVAIDTAPVVTLTGVGGVGKTRLALQVAAEAVGRFPDGAWFVDLGPVADAGFVAPTFSAALALPERRQGTIEESIVAALRDRNLLVVLDNCEHLIETAAELVDTIVGSCPGVRVLATSREALDVDGEDTYEVRPLTSPDVSGATGPDALDNDAVRLFADRARSAKRGFVLSEENQATIAEICRRLDGIPLALELAAARLKVMSPSEVLARLDERLPLLTGGRRSALERHQTLRGAIDWSYALLEPGEQLLFARLSVFAGGFTLPAVEQVCVDDETVTAPAALTLLAGLVAKSMVVAHDTDGGSRYRLLETMREYARERLAELDDAGRVHALHAAYFVETVEVAIQMLKGSDDQIAAARLGVEQENMRAALVWSQAHDLETFLRLVPQVALYWQILNNFREMSTWTRAALEHAAALQPDARAELLAFAASAANYANRFDDAFRLYEQSIKCSRSAGLVPVPFALSSLGIAALEANRPEEAVAQCEAGVDAARTIGDLYWELFAMGNLALAYGLSGHRERGVATAEEMVAGTRRLGNQWLAGTALLAAGINRVLDEPEHAIPLLEESSLLLQSRGNGAQTYFFRGIALLRLGRPGEGVAMLRASLPLMQETGSDFFTGTVVGTCASVLSRAAPTAAATLLGALERMRVDSGVEGAPNDVDVQQRTRARLERSMDAAELAAAWARGAELSVDEAADLAYGELGKLEAARDPS